MTGTKQDLVKYRLSRAWDTFDDAKILSSNGKWNSTINRLYYAAYYAVTALLIQNDIKTTTHNGTKLSFSEHFIKTNFCRKNMEKHIPNFLHGDKKAITMTYSTSTKIK